MESVLVKGMIFDIKRYAIHDGPGIRTTFFLKGCSLKCQWCHNPEGRGKKPEMMLYPLRCAEHCDECIGICPKNSLSKKTGSIEIEREKCDCCGECQKICVYEAIKVVGKEMSVEDIINEVEKDMIFFDDSKGGITFSGGEPLLQIDFLEAVLDRLKELAIHTAVDTSGFVSFESLAKVAEKVDIFLFDLKMMDDARHIKYTGVSNRKILRNLKKLSAEKTEISIRIPLIKGVNDDLKNISETAEFVRSLKNIREINLLPYHKGGFEKLRRLGKEKNGFIFETPSRKRIEEIKKIFKDYGFAVIMGG